MYNTWSIYVFSISFVYFFLRLLKSTLSIPVLYKDKWLDMTLTSQWEIKDAISASFLTVWGEDVKWKEGQTPWKEINDKSSLLCCYLSESADWSLPRL